MTLAAILAMLFSERGGSGFGISSRRARICGSGSGSRSKYRLHHRSRSRHQRRSASPAPASTAPAGQPQTSPSPANTAAKPRAHHKKAAVPDCATSSGTGSADGSFRPAEPAGGGAMPVKPCPPPIVVIKNGGSDEPIVETQKATRSTEQASYERFTTEQLTGRPKKT